MASSFAPASASVFSRIALIVSGRATARRPQRFFDPRSPSTILPHRGRWWQLRAPGRDRITDRGHHFLEAVDHRGAGDADDQGAKNRDEARQQRLPPERLAHPQFPPQHVLGSPGHRIGPSPARRMPSPPPSPPVGENCRGGNDRELRSTLPRRRHDKPRPQRCVRTQTLKPEKTPEPCVCPSNVMTRCAQHENHPFESDVRQ